MGLYADILPPRELTLAEAITEAHEAETYASAFWDIPDEDWTDADEARSAELDAFARQKRDEMRAAFARIGIDADLLKKLGDLL